MRMKLPKKSSFFQEILNKLQFVLPKLPMSIKIKSVLSVKKAKFLISASQNAQLAQKDQFSIKKTTSVSLKFLSPPPQQKANVLGVDINGTELTASNVKSLAILKIARAFAQTVTSIMRIVWSADLDKKSVQRKRIISFIGTEVSALFVIFQGPLFTKR